MDQTVPPTKAHIQVIARASAILHALENEHTGLSLGQIAKRVNLARSTVQRIVAALESEHFVMAASPSGRVVLGPAIRRLATSLTVNFVTQARPHLERLSSLLHETVDLAALKGDHLVFIDQIVGSYRLRAVSAVGDVFPLYCTANGKAYLATLEPAQIEALLGRSFPARTPHTLRTLDALLANLETTRRDGIAYDLEEHTLGISAAGVGLTDTASGNFYAISVPVPTQRFDDCRERLADQLFDLKQALSEQVALG